MRPRDSLARIVPQLSISEDEQVLVRQFFARGDAQPSRASVSLDHRTGDAQIVGPRTAASRPVVDDADPSVRLDRVPQTAQKRDAVVHLGIDVYHEDRIDLA